MVIRPSRRSSGITLIEMMIVVVILGVLAAIVAPNLLEAVARNRLDSSANEFTTALDLARSESIRRGANVVVRRAAGSATREWTKGWEVFVDLPAAGAASGNNQRDAGEELLSVGQPMSAPLTLYSSRNVPDFLAFTPSGRAAGGPNQYIFVLCYGGVVATADGRARSRAVMVNDSGRVRAAAPNSAGQLIVDTATGTAAVTSCTSP